MGYQRSVWRGGAGGAGGAGGGGGAGGAGGGAGGAGGGGGGAAVVMCSCSCSDVQVSFRDRRVFLRRWFESPRLSITSISSDERAPSATPPDASDALGPARRPASLISSLSSGSGSSRDDPPAPPAESCGSDVNLNLIPEPPPQDRKGRSFVHNNNNRGWTPRGSGRRQQPFIGGTMAPNPQLSYLDRVVMEIIETERMYVRDLRMIVEDYLAHIIDQSDLSIRPEQVCSLFGNIEDIYEFNSELLQALDLCDNDPVAIARCFVMKSEYFEIYTQYCTNYPNSVASLTECMRNKSLAKFFRERQASLKCSLPLGSYLLKPVQRILKYHLLLQEIAKHFDPEEEGYEVVEDAIYTMTGVAWYINDMKRKHEHAVRLQEVQSLLLNWKGPDLTTYGELVLEGTFKVHRAKNERTLFLFDRMLLLTKRRGEHYVYKTHISCSTLMLIESAKDALSFSVTHYKHPKQPHTVQAKSVEEKKLWAHHIKRIILENHHAIIPQKAKEAILEMDSMYPSRYRYSPERLKKALSSHSDEFPRDARHARRQSEPTKQILKSAKELEAEGGAVSSHTETENGQIPEEEEAGGAEPTPEQPPAEEDKTCEPTENPEPPLSGDLDPPQFSEPPQKNEELKADLDPPEEPASATPDSDSKTLSSGESSEDEADEKDPGQKELLSPSILPSSVLDKASAIAQHFTNSIKRGSLVQDETRSLSCASPRLPSRTNSCVSLSAEPSDRPLRLNSISSDPPESSATDVTLLSPRDDSLFDADQGIRRRRDSTLSRQDQLLIGKIKTYYESAGNQDATFSLQRRESLTYIPAGLVRSSVNRFDGIPPSEPAQTNASTTTSSTRSDLSSADLHDYMVSSDSLDSLKSYQRSIDLEDSGESHRSRSQSIQESPSEEEDFRPSSEMIKIWQALEQEVTQSEDKGRGRSRDSQTSSRAAVGLSGVKSKSCDRESGGSDLSTITEESTSPSTLKAKIPEVNRTGSLKNALKVFGDEAVLRPPVPHVVQLRAKGGERSSKDSAQQDEVDKTNNKVLHLARQYSQRIKTTKPVVRQRSQGVLISKNSLACVLEEESPGKRSLTLPLRPADQVLSPPPGLTVEGRSRLDSVGRARSRSPLSPPPIEGFNWPDVRQLRSKYVNDGRTQKSPVGRSRSIPEQMFDRRHSSCSPTTLTEGGPGGAASCRLQEGREERRQRLHRANSLDPRLSGAQMTELRRLQDQAANHSCHGYYVAAEAPLQNDPEHKIIVMERLPEPAETESTDEAGESYVQIRSPTSREKISIMAVIDRCRAYQDSDEYKQREEAKLKTEPAEPKTTSDQDPESQKTRPDTGQQSMVKNLREKFQSLS